MTRTFGLGDVLSITTGRLLSPRHMDGVYDILDFLTNDTLNTVALVRAAAECKPWLLRWFPELGAVNDEDYASIQPLIDQHGVEAAMALWVEAVREKHGLRTSYALQPIPADDHETLHPSTELARILGPEAAAEKSILMEVAEE